MLRRGAPRTQPGPPQTAPLFLPLLPGQLPQVAQQAVPAEHEVAEDLCAGAEQFPSSTKYYLDVSAECPVQYGDPAGLSQATPDQLLLQLLLGLRQFTARAGLDGVSTSTNHLDCLA